MNENEIGTAVIDVATEIHRALGPGLLERVYQVLLLEELQALGLRVESEVPVPIVCRGRRLEEAFRADLIVESRVLLELKSSEEMKSVFSKQVLTYLKLTGMRLGYVINFGAPLLKLGLCRVINGDLSKT